MLCLWRTIYTRAIYSRPPPCHCEEAEGATFSRGEAITSLLLAVLASAMGVVLRSLLDKIRPKEI